jgi:predicted helicase
MSFQRVLDKYRKISFSERDKGDRFERLMQAYLLTDPKYANQFKKVWLWNDFIGRRDLGGSDTGIDLVALTFDGDYWAIQCKCYQANSRIDKPAVDSFLATSSREFKGEDLKTTRFAHRMWISTTNNWGTNATQAIKNQNPPVSRVNLFDLIEAPVDWEALDKGVHGKEAQIEKHTLRAHQKEALDAVHKGFTNADRGKLIMACGTGKTFTSLRIAEFETDNSGVVLFLVPSIALLGQTLREWSAQANEPINPVCICSDPDISKTRKKNADIDTFSVVDLAMPASTDPQNILKQFENIKANKKPGMTVVFSTYQSIDVIATAQSVLMKNGFPEFDLIICDEAHRTTGVSVSGEDESAFTKVHNNDFIKAKKRLYMTATPRLYSDDAKSKAAQSDALLCSMDDPEIYGEDLFRIGFGEAVDRGMLTDYKVIILTLNDADVPPAVQKMISRGAAEINTDDVSKLIGCINAMSKQFLGDDGVTKKTDPTLMKRAVAFCPSIKASNAISSSFNEATEVYLDALPTKQKQEMVSVTARHMDGTMSAPQRDEMLGWLKEETTDNECRVITNVRVLSEGVDVPSLDAVLFLSARNSQVDVVQSVGRVMRRAPGKEYGYIIIPVVIPSDIEPEKAMADNDRYKVVWTVLNALRAHDDRFNATVNKIDINRKRPDNILIGTPVVGFSEDGSVRSKDSSSTKDAQQKMNEQLRIQFEQLQSVVYAKLVERVGSRRYWEEWAKDVAEVAQRQIERITFLVTERKDQRKAFLAFLKGLQGNINPSIDEDQAVEMLAQHIITKPIFEALFEGYSFEKNNPVSQAMQKMLSALEGESVADESETLQQFYESVRRRVEGIDNAEGKQRIVVELYDKFFRTAFPKLVEQLGIVYTPVEVVDFIVNSVEDVLQQEFGRSISDENVHILDPFTGTGTFVVRLLQSGLIKPKDLERKFRNEIHANEIVLLAYYIAAVNIETTFHDLIGREKDYEPFNGIVLTDTFQLGELSGDDVIFDESFPKNSERVRNQKKAPIRVIIGNPPYSIGQKSANDNAQNQEYTILDSRIANTYAYASNAGLSKSLYDSYIKAFRWATDRLDKENGGVIAFVSNGAWLDGNSTDGFRKVIEKEFSSIWVLNLRGNQRTSGELSRKEGGKIFGSGSRTPISITLLVKNPSSNADKATIHYHDIGDYLSREEKLAIVKKFKSVGNKQMDWKSLQTNQYGDWLKQRNEIFETFISMAPEKKFDLKGQSFFVVQGPGILTSRDIWVYGFSRNQMAQNVRDLISFYNSQRTEFEAKRISKPDIKVSDFINSDPTKISWTRALKKDLEKNKPHSFHKKVITKGYYRPFCKQQLYYDKSLVESPGLNQIYFPEPNAENVIISIPGIGGTKDFTTVISNSPTDYQVQFNNQCFPLYYYEEREKNNPSLFDSAGEREYIRKDGVSDFILKRAKKIYGKNVDKEDIFYYVYGILHSPDYRTAFANDLKKMLPRIPLIEDVRDFWKFSKAGRGLAELHINYEQVPPYEGVEVSGEGSKFFKVEKMRFPKKEGEVRGKKKKVNDKSTILFNSKITISNIPERAYEYVVNGKSAIEWIMERYQVKVDKKSGIKNDPNDWAEEVSNPRYILDLLLSIINVSIQTVAIVESLPRLDFDKE